MATSLVAAQNAMATKMSATASSHRSGSAAPGSQMLASATSAISPPTSACITTCHRRRVPTRSSSGAHRNLRFQGMPRKLR